ncbi:MAG: hypothetical protein Q9227_003974 [Pyrenula ochraceoflavens]
MALDDFAAEEVQKAKIEKDQEKIADLCTAEEKRQKFYQEFVVVAYETCWV